MLSSKSLSDTFNAIKNINSYEADLEVASLGNTIENIIMHEVLEVLDSIPDLTYVKFVERPISPYAFQNNLLDFWPKIKSNQNVNSYFKIYSKVRKAGLTNYIKARIPIPSGLNIIV